MAVAVRILLSLVALLSFGAPGSASAEPGLVGRPLAACVLKAEPGMTPTALFAQPARFDCVTPQYKFGAGDYWVLSAPVAAPGSSEQPVPIRYASVWQRQATLYVRYADGYVDRRLIDDVEQSRAIQIGAIVEQRTAVRGVPVDRLLWHVEGSANLRGILMGVHVATLRESARSNTAMAALYAGFIGLCAALLVHNIALWQALRHRFQIAYVAMLTALILYGLSSSGALSWLIDGIPNTLRLRLNYLSLAFSAAAGMMFARSFFEERVFTGWTGRLATGAAIGVASAGVIFMLLAPLNVRLFDRVFAVSFIPVLAIVVPILWRAWRMRSNYLWLFALAWAAPILFGGLRLLNSMIPARWSFWLDNSTLVAMTFEALLSSMAIAYRVRLLARERDDARAEEIAARLLADTDPLTGLLNRRAFLARAIGRDGPQVLLLADVDHFKQVNETIGHDGGDEVLRRLARALRKIVPPDALIARMGGEEFAILAPRLSALEPDSVIAALRTTPMPFDLTVTASIGASTGELITDQQWKALYKPADRALFEAKAAGRDRSRLAVGGWAIAA